MATITLYKEKVNGVGGLIDNLIKSSSNLNVQLGTLKNTLQGVDSSTCNLQDTVDSISSSSKSEKSKIEDLKKLNNKLSEFIETASRKDSAAEEEIKKSKEDFYTKYSYLKPECEKSVIEHICDGVQSAIEWCKEHWKFIATVALVAIAVVLLCTGVGSGLGAAIIAGACWGAILGAVIGGVSGGINSAIQGGSFFDGFESGAFDGAVGGAIGGAITGGLTFVAGPALSMVGSIGRGAGIGALSNGVSNMCVTTIDYLAEHGNLNGALDDIAMSGFSGIVSGGILGGISGGIRFNSPSKTAKSWQGKDDYPGIDDYVDVNMHKGDILYRGEPNGTEYFTTLDAIEDSGRNATTLFEGLQVKPHPIYGFRGQVSGYKFTKTVTVGYGQALANPQFGTGGLEQFYVPNVQKLIDKGILVLVETINLTK
jgi:hypothetical protein